MVPGNYSTHALQFFKDLSELSKSQPGTGPMRVIADLVVELLGSSVKFLLPDNGSLVEDHDFRPDFFDLMRLPYPVCALEFSADDSLFNPDSGLHFSGRRISLVFDPTKVNTRAKQLLNAAIHPDFIAELPERPIAVMAIYDLDDGKAWAMSNGIGCFDADNDRPVETKNENNPLLQQTRHLLKGQGTKHGLPATYTVFRDFIRLSGMDVDEAIRSVYVDTIDEFRAAWQFMAAINCSNVKTQVLPASAKLNKKREAKGLVPMFDYHVLDIGTQSESSGGAGGKGSHNSPRTHLRRGHIRRLGEKFGNKMVWINATVVNPGHGQVTKDYRLKTK